MKEVIIEYWNKIIKEIIPKCIGVFKSRLRRVIKVEAQHIEQHLLLIILIQIYTSQYVFVKCGMILIN